MTTPAAEAPADEALMQFVADRSELLAGQWFGQMTPAQARQSFDAITLWNRDKGPAPQVDRVHDDVVDGDIPIRIYRPPGEASGLLVFLHGGGFVFGSIDSHDEIARFICAEAGVVVVSVDYPLSPEHPFPAPLEASLAVVRWAGEHASELGTPGPLLVGGDSAGGALTASVAVECRQQNVPLDGQVIIYAPLLDPAHADWVAVQAWDDRDQTFGPTQRSTDYYWRSYTPDADPAASPLLAPDLSCLAPALVVVADLDTYCTEGIAYADALEHAGVAVRLLRFPRINHGFLVHGWLPADRRSPVAHDASRQVAHAIRALTITTRREATR